MSDFSDKISFLGEINVLSCKIITSMGKVADISAIVADITLYEDIFSNSMSGYVLVQDSLDLINSLPLIGQEQIIIELQTPTLSSKITKTFYIYKLQNRIVKKRSQIYQLCFCSKELIYSNNSKISKAYSGNIGDTVASIFTDQRYIGSSSILYMDKPKNDYSFIPAYWTPFETINWLTGKSINSHGVSNYLFYETNQSFEYVSVDKLISTVPEREYIFSDIDPSTAFGAAGVDDNKYKIVESMDNDITFDYLRNLSGGMYSSKLYTYDLTSKSININTFDYIDDFDKSNHLGSVPKKTSDLMRKKLASLYFIHKNNYVTGSYKAQGYKDFFLQRNSLLEQLFAFKINIKVPGRTDIKAGNTIIFTVPDIAKVTKEDISSISSDYFSGKYLVTAIRHQIVSGKHTMWLEIISDSFVKNLITK